MTQNYLGDTLGGAVSNAVSTFVGVEHPIHIRLINDAMEILFELGKLLK